MSSATGLPRLTRLRPGQTRFSIYDPSGSGIVVINRDEPDIEYGGSGELAVVLDDHERADACRAELAAMALSDDERARLSAELDALDRIDEWMRGH